MNGTSPHGNKAGFVGAMLAIALVGSRLLGERKVRPYQGKGIVP